MSMQTREAFDLLTQKKNEKQQEYDALTILTEALQIANEAEDRTATAQSKLTDIETEISAQSIALQQVTDSTNAKLDDLNKLYSDKKSSLEASHKAFMEDIANQKAVTQAELDSIKAQRQAEFDAHTADVAARTTENSQLAKMRDDLLAEINGLTARVAAITHA